MTPKHTLRDRWEERKRMTGKAKKWPNQERGKIFYETAVILTDTTDTFCREDRNEPVRATKRSTCSKKVRDGLWAKKKVELEHENASTECYCIKAPPLDGAMHQYGKITRQVEGRKREATKWWTTQANSVQTQCEAIVKAYKKPA